MTPIYNIPLFPTNPSKVNKGGSREHVSQGEATQLPSKSECADLQDLPAKHLGKTRGLVAKDLGIWVPKPYSPP